MPDSEDVAQDGTRSIRTTGRSDDRTQVHTVPRPGDTPSGEVTGSPEDAAPGGSWTRLGNLGRNVTRRTGKNGRARAVDDGAGQGPQASPDARLDRMVERRCDQFRQFGRAHRLALETPERSLTYDALDTAANRLSRFLRRRRFGPGDRVAVLLDRPADALVAQLAVAKLGAASVPLAPDLPDQSLAAVLAASGAGVVLTTAPVAPRLEASDVDAIYLDRVAAHIDSEDVRRLPEAERVSRHESPAYVVVHADGPGRGLRAPAIGHPAVTNVVQVVTELVDIGVDDRVYHDPRLGSDLTVLETWLPWSCGATVVTPPAGANLRGPTLGKFLRDRRVTVLRADPELLAGVHIDLPDLRLVLVSGTDRPHGLIAAWQRPGRRLIGLHGPPETTVAALWSELRTGRTATLGRPLPTYGVVVLDPDDPTRALPAGVIGEIGITGVGVARGYVGREDLTREAFVTGTASDRVFRTGDLGRVTRDGEVERIARLDRVAGRGARFRPWQVSGPPGPPGRPGTSKPPRNRTSVLHLPPTPPVAPSGPAAPPVSPLKPPPGRPPTDRRPPGVPGRTPPPPPVGLRPGEAAPPTPRAEPTPKSPASPVPASASSTPGIAAPATQAALAELLAGVLGRDDVPADAHFFDDLGADSLLMARFCARIRKHPQLPSAAMQDIYQNTTLASLARALAPAPARPNGAAVATTRALLATILGSVLGRESVPADAHFFNDLGADSLMMARFCAKVRKHPGLPAVAMPDIYRHTSLASLAASLAPAGGASAEPSPATPVPGAASTGPRASTLSYVLCGAAQLLFLLAYTLATAVFLTWAFGWVTVASGPLDLYLRALVVGVAGFVGLSLLPVALKWLLVGRWQPGSIRVWSPAYLRFWIVKTVIRTSPMVLFAGTPAFSLYLRALGAKIGPGVVLLTRQVPVATDLFSVGRGTLVRKDAVVSGYRAHDGRIEIGGVSLGDNVVVGESTVLDIRTSMADGAALSHSSSLHPGQTVPAGETWHGSPGRRAAVVVPTVPHVPCGRLRRALYPTLDLAAALLVIGPVGVWIAVTLYATVPEVAALVEPGPGALSTGDFYVRTLILSSVLYFGAVLGGLGLVFTLPRLLALGVRADRVYPLYGIHYWLHQAVVNLTNVKAFVELFGDSSAIAHYLGGVGYRLRPFEQTGSNFGMAVKHENPYLTSVGAGTVVADGLSVMNADYSATSFRVSRTAIGARNFLGNRIAYPTQGRTGDDCLLATKVAVPLEGPVRTGVGLLGSPSFEIPRTVARDAQLDVTDASTLARSLRRKNRHNLGSMALHLTVRWLFAFMVLLAVAAVAALPVALGAVEVLVVEVTVLLLTVTWFVLVERRMAHLQTLAPQGCSIYDPAFWRHERYWKVPSPTWMQLLNGTPFKSEVWRLLGVRIGARVFDDGAAISERGFTTIGDDCTLGEGAVIQCHSQEDGGFKSDHVVIGARCTLGVNSFVHYGTTLGDDAILAPDTFLMKGEEVPAGERWGGNPAREMVGPS